MILRGVQYGEILPATMRHAQETTTTNIDVTDDN